MGRFAQYIPDRPEPFVGPGTSLVARFTNAISPSLLNDSLRVTPIPPSRCRTRTGPAGRQFQRNPTLDQPLVADASAPGQCNPTLSVDPSAVFRNARSVTSSTMVSAGRCRELIFWAQMPLTGAGGLRPIPPTCRGATRVRLMPIRDDVSKSWGKHTLQFGGAVRLLAA